MLNETKPATPQSMGQTANRSIGDRTTAITGGAAKVFREFKWGLLTLFLLMVVVISLVYDGKGKKDTAAKPKTAPSTTENTTSNGAGAGTGTGLDADLPPNPGDNLPPNFGNGLDQPNGIPQGPGVTSGDPALNGGRALGSDHIPQTNPPVNNLRPNVPSGPPTNLGAPGLVPVHPHPEHSAEPAPNSVPATYVVASGDTLTGIAQKLFPGRSQAGMRALSEANKNLFTDPRRMREGMTLKVPVLPAATAANAQNGAGAGTGGTAVKKENSPANKPTEANSAKKEADLEDTGTYTVQAGDTLERIARRLLKDANRWDELYEWNRDRLSDPSHLRVGQKLRTSAGTAPTHETKLDKPGKKDHSVAQKEDEAPKIATRTETPVLMERTTPASEPASGWMP